MGCATEYRVCLHEIYSVLYLCKVTQLLWTVVLSALDFFPITERNFWKKNILFGKRWYFPVLRNAWYLGKTCSAPQKDLFISRKYTTLYFILRKEDFCIFLHIITSTVREYFFLLHSVFFHVSSICCFCLKLVFPLLLHGKCKEESFANVVFP